MFDFIYTIVINPLTQILEAVYYYSFKLLKEHGISIIVISFTVSFLCLPLYNIAEKWQQIERNIQKKLQAKSAKIRSSFTGDERFMILSTYYRQNNYHPIYALRTSFGLLIQIPFFIAAYSYLSNLEAIKNVSFLFIKDLGAPDAIFSINNVSINILPIIMTFVNLVSSVIYTHGLSRKDKIQLYGMAVIFLVLLYNSPSGLVLYWTLNNVFSLLKNLYTKIPYKHKSKILLGLFSVFCLLLSIFTFIKFGYSSKAQKLIFASIFVSIVPWITIVLRKNFSKFFNITFDNKKSLFTFILSAFLLWALFGLYIPSQLIVASPQEFSFIDEYTTPIVFIVHTAAQFFGFFVFWPICLYFLFSNNVKKYFSIAFLILAICMTCNVFLFHGDYGILSINFIYDRNPGHSTQEMLFNGVILLLIASILFIVFRFVNKKIIMVPLALSIFSLTTISGINLFTINSAFVNLRQYYVKQETEIDTVSPLFSLSRTGQNVVVIMLDRAISVFVPFIFEESPELKEKYSGFVFYPNTVSFNGYTSIGTPPIFGGYEYTPEEINKRTDTPLVEKHNQALLMLPRIFSEHGFNVSVTDPPYANYNNRSDLSIYSAYPDIHAYTTDGKYTDIWLAENNLELSKTGATINRNMFWYSILKGLPLFFRQVVYMDGDWCSVIPNHTLRLTINGYSVLDYLDRLITISDAPQNTALMMANLTTHENSYLQAPDYTPVISTSNFGNGRYSKDKAFHINAAAIKRLADWFDFLKKENLYDNTRIILVSDHGPEPNFFTRIGLPINVDQFNSFLMVKDFNSSGDIKTDMAFMSTADVPSLSLVDLIDNPVNPFTGNPVSMDRKKDPLYIAVSGSIYLERANSNQYYLNEQEDYYVHDDIFVKENWIPASSAD